MSGIVQTAVLSPVLQESKTTPNKQHKKMFFHPKQQLKSKSFGHHVPSDSEKLLKKRQKTNFPGKFLLGGNINDPLNLNGLLNETDDDKKISPSFPLPKPKPSYRTDAFDVIIRPNIKDPLNLEGTYDDTTSYLMLDTNRKPRKHRRSVSKMEQDGNDNNTSHGELEISINEINDSATIDLKRPEKEIRKRKRAHSLSINGSQYEKANKITSTISDENLTSLKLQKTDTSIEQIGFSRSMSCLESTKKQANNINSIATSSTKRVSIKIDDDDNSITIQESSDKITSTPDNKASTSLKSDDSKNEFKFIHGNYNRYYGYRNPENENDPRLDYLKPEWFKDKNVLDIGCNVGHVTLQIAKNFEPKKIVGMDIDVKLIYTARKNIRFYMDKVENEKKKYPISCNIVHGSLMTQSSLYFPKNVYFIQGDYVPQSDDYVNQIKSEYDFVLALSITKWIHLNNGDEGIKRFFKKIYLNLTVNGALLLEPQSWVSYKKKAKLNKDTWENYNKIKFKPNDFTKYLLSKEIGFSTCRTIAMPHNKSKGFRRPIFLFTKLEVKSSNQQRKEPTSEVESKCDREEANGEK